MYVGCVGVKIRKYYSIYTNSDFDYNIILEERTYEVAREITEYLKSTGRMQKTIVFCATEEHADRIPTFIAFVRGCNAGYVRDMVLRFVRHECAGIQMHFSRGRVQDQRICIQVIDVDVQ